MKRYDLTRLFAAGLVSCALAACGADDDNTSAPTPSPPPVQPPSPTPSPAPGPALPAQLPTTFSWTSPSSLSGSTQLVRSGSAGSAEGTIYTFSADSGGRITVSGGTVISTMSTLAEQGALLQLCRVAGNGGTAAVMLDASLSAVGASDLDGKTFDELACQSSSGEFVASGSFYQVGAGVATFFEDANMQVGQEQVSVLLGAGSNQFQAELGTVRWRAYRRPGGSIVIVETQTGGSGANAEPAAVHLYAQR